MKKLLLAGNIVLFVLLLMAHRPGGGTEKPQAADPDIKLGINPLLSRQMLIDYREDIWRGRKVKGENLKDSRSVWFSLEKLKAFIAEIERMAVPNEPGCGGARGKGLGIRFYFAVYPDSALTNQKGWRSYFTDHGLPSSYHKLHTLVMVPTLYNDPDGFNYDFDPRFRTANSNCNFTSMKDVMNTLLTTGARLRDGKYVTGFAPSNIVPDDKTFMLMCDNRDTWLNKYGAVPALVQRRITNGGETNSGSSGTAGSNESLNTNAGTLAPPPYPNLVEPGLETMRVAAGSRNMLNRKIHIPASGASYMRWVDDTNDTGWVTPPIQRVELKTDIKGLKQQ